MCRGLSRATLSPDLQIGQESLHGRCHRHAAADGQLQMIGVPHSVVQLVELSALDPSCCIVTRQIERHRKPVLVSEEYQAELIERTCDVADSKPYCIGTHVWNFADFRTAQVFHRVVENRKGVFTRTREPKLAAHRLRARWIRRAAPKAAGR